MALGDCSGLINKAGGQRPDAPVIPQARDQLLDIRIVERFGTDPVALAEDQFDKQRDLCCKYQLLVGLTYLVNCVHSSRDKDFSPIDITNQICCWYKE